MPWMFKHVFKEQTKQQCMELFRTVVSSESTSGRSRSTTELAPELVLRTLKIKTFVRLITENRFTHQHTSPQKSTPVL